MRAIILSLLLVFAGCASTGGRISSGVATIAGLVVIASVADSFPPHAGYCEGDCMRPDHHVLIGGALTVGLVAVMAAAFFELHKYSTSHTQVIIQP